MKFNCNFFAYVRYKTAHMLLPSVGASRVLTEKVRARLIGSANYRPLDNIPFVNKMPELIVEKQQSRPPKTTLVSTYCTSSAGYVFNNKIYKT